MMLHFMFELSKQLGLLDQEKNKRYISSRHFIHVILIGIITLPAPIKGIPDIYRIRE